jgi:nucleotide-binding universal stress UspA family protein
MVVTMAMFTTLAMPPMLRAALLRVPMRSEEKARIDREEVDEYGFLPALERLLLAVDESRMGKFTARLAGLIAGAHGMPITILRLADDAKAGPGTQDSLARQVKTGAKASAAKMIADDAEPDPEKVHISEAAPAPQVPPSAVIMDEARKGYDMLLIGVEDCCEEDGTFSSLVSNAAAGFAGNVGILAHSDPGSAPTLRRGSRLLVAVNGSEVSSHAAELSFAIARAVGAQVTAVYGATKERKRRIRAREQEVLKDAVRLADRYNVALQTRIVGHGDAARAIIDEAMRGYDLVIMGVGARPGPELFFGNTATKVMASIKTPVLFLASKPLERSARKPTDNQA